MGDSGIVLPSLPSPARSDGTASRACDAPPPVFVACEHNRRLAPRTHGYRRRAQALLFLFVALPFAAHGQPAAPTGLAATPGDSSATLTWTDPSDSSITGYSYSYATSVAAFTSGSPPAWTTVAGGASATSQAVSGLTNGTRYYFRLRATNSGGNSPVAQTTIQLAASPSTAVTISDANLRAVLESALGKSAGATITQLEMATLTSLDASNSSISVLTGIGRAVNLTTLSASNNSIADVTALGTLVELRSLDLWGNFSISDISALGTLTSLTDLDLRLNAISDISALGTLTSLTELALSTNTISDISALGTLTSLTELELRANAISNISALGTLTSLTSLYLGENAISDVSALGTLTSLEVLHLSRNTISDISALGALTSLRRLHASYNSISTVSPLGTLASLEWLSLIGNTISDISGLGTLTSLTYLDLDGNAVSDLSALGMLTSLEFLYLKDNAISDVSALGTLTGLLILELAGNSISDVSALGTLAALRRLELYNNAISDVSGLGTLTGLLVLELAGNSISDVSALADLEGLLVLDLHGNTVLTVAPLAEGTVFSNPRDDSTLLSGRLFEFVSRPTLYLTGGNPVCALAITPIRTLEARGVDVVCDPLPPGTANQAPKVAAQLADMALAEGETQTVALAGAFVDPDNDELSYRAWSSDEAVATAWAAGAQLRVRGRRVGVVDVFVQATDSGGLAATQQLRVTVGASLSLTDGEAAGAGGTVREVPEGGMVRLVAALSVPRASATTFGWRVVQDDDPNTANADAGEYGGASGEATIPAGETTTEITIAIADDTDIEPAREWFDVVVSAPADGCCVLAQARVSVVVLEGVCDRTPAVANALRDGEPCTAPTPAALATRTRLAVEGAGTLRAGDFQGLAGLRWLALNGNDLSALPAGLFAGLAALRELDLSDNALTMLPPSPFQALPRLRVLDLSANDFETLPAGLFAGLSLREASVAGNPGAPFALAADLARTDADEPWAPGPATVEGQLPLGAPFPLRVSLTAEPTATGLPAMLTIPAGATASAAFAAAAPPNGGALVLRTGAATLPATTCGAEWPFRSCFRGFTPMPGAPLTLFRQPPRALPAPQPEALAGDCLRLPLTSLVAAGDAPGALRWQATSSDDSVATVRVTGGELVVEPEPRVEGVTEIVLVATDSAGLSATVRFEVRVEFFAPARWRAGWRAAVGHIAQ